MPDSVLRITGSRVVRKNAGHRCKVADVSRLTTRNSAIIAAYGFGAVMLVEVAHCFQDDVSARPIFKVTCLISSGEAAASSQIQSTEVAAQPRKNQATEDNPPKGPVTRIMAATPKTAPTIALRGGLDFLFIVHPAAELATYRSHDISAPSFINRRCYR